MSNFRVPHRTRSVHAPGSPLKAIEPRSPRPQSPGSGQSKHRLLQPLNSEQDNDTSDTNARRFTVTHELGADDYHLAITGYEPILRRFLTPWDSLFVVLATMGLATSIPAIIFLVSMYAGGPVTALTNWIVIGMFSIVLVLCLGEIAASMPTSAGNDSNYMILRIL